MASLGQEDKKRFGQPLGRGQRHIGFLLCPSFTMLPFTSAIEPLRVANRISGDTLYSWSLITQDGEDVQASNGIVLSPHDSIHTVTQLSRVFVTGPFDPRSYRPHAVLEWLRRLAGQNVHLGALETGTFLLARAGLLRGRRCTTHWENLPLLESEHPELTTSNELFELHRDRFSCAGGTSALDLSLSLIELDCGADLAAAVAETFVYQNIRSADVPQRMSVRERTGVKNEHLLRAVSLMESRIERPLGMPEIADKCGLSKRQLERLFRTHLATTPARYYLAMRLKEARRLALHTGMAVTDIALSCGFSSVGHFSHAYKQYFGVSPRQHRRDSLS